MHNSWCTAHNSVLVGKACLILHLSEDIYGFCSCNYSKMFSIHCCTSAERHIQWKSFRLLLFRSFFILFYNLFYDHVISSIRQQWLVEHNNVGNFRVYFSSSLSNQMLRNKKMHSSVFDWISIPWNEMSNFHILFPLPCTMWALYRRSFNFE